MIATEAQLRAEVAVGQGSRNALLLESLFSALRCDVGSGVGRATADSLRRVDAALRDNSLHVALRDIDRAWRSLPDDADTLAPVYGRLLALEHRDHDATLRLLERAPNSDPDLAALKVQALRSLLRGDEARRHLDESLKDFGVQPVGLLALVASEMLQQWDTPTPGWIGLSPDLEFIGELAGHVPARALDIRLSTGAEITQALSMPLQNGRRPFRFQLPNLEPGDSMQVSCQGVPLLGSGLRLPTNFGLDGRADATAGAISGWVRLGWLPTQPIDLSIEDERGARHLVKTRSLAQPGFRWPFVLNLRQTELRGSRLEISALMVGGNRKLPLPDTPLLLEPAVRLKGGRPAPLPRRFIESTGRAKASVKRAAAVDIIIPVYRGREETLLCIDAALSTAADARIIVVDDATDDAVLAAALDDLETAGQITLLRNAANLGFVGSVNRALTRNRTHDAVLLNSDALVFGDWLERLRAAAYRAPHVGTVTPFSNSGSIASYPRADERPMSQEEGAAMHRLASATHSGVSREIPVGVGFCLYLRRDCLRAVGDLDASIFGKGYGEETDFCLRARLLGWSHHLAADVFVLHAGGRSFGTRRAALLDRSQRLLNLRHPGYDRFVAGFITQDPLNSLRRALDQQRLAALNGTFVLLVTMALPGGVQRFVAERCRTIRAQGCIPLLLRPSEPRNAARCELWTDAIDIPNLQYDVPSDLGAMESLLRKLPVQEIEIHHFLHIDPRVIDMVRTLEAPYDVVVHDYSWICPRITLIDGSGRYCGEPKVATCESCVRRHGSHLGERITAANLRLRSDSWLRAARRVITPSADTSARLKKYFPIDVEVRSHTEPAASPISAPRSSTSNVLRVAVIGAIGEHKGFHVLLNCARDAKNRRLPLEFIVIGYTENDEPLLKTGKVSITGRYSEGEAPHLLRREKPDIAFLPSVWPETWCYAMDEAVAAGLAVVAFDLGAIAERVRSTGLGTILPLGLGPRQINDQLLECVPQSKGTTEHGDVITKGIRDSSQMNNKLPEKESARSEALSASVQVLPLPTGLYLFSVKAASAVTDLPAGQLRLPAMHVGLGPGVSSDQVEFISGPSTDSRWLFAQEDLLVTKVSGANATLILTSVRAPGGEVLSIKVERLDSRLEGAVADLPAAAVPVLPSIPQKVPLTAPKQPLKEGAATHSADDGLPLQIGTHIRARGDLSFTAVPWAGRVAPGLWIESFSVRPLEYLKAGDVEYKGLTGSGFETPWLSDDKMCGTKGMSVPLVGFAVRLKPGAQTKAYDCEYSGYFKSGITVGPLRNGAPCRSTVANDPLEGIQVRIFKRPGAERASDVGRGDKGTVAAVPTNGHVQGPSFGRYRDQAGVGGNKHTSRNLTNGKSGTSKRTAKPTNDNGAKSKTSAVSGKPVKAKLDVKRNIRANNKPNGAASNHRPTARRS